MATGRTNETGDVQAALRAAFAALGQGNAAAAEAEARQVLALAGTRDPMAAPVDAVVVLALSLAGQRRAAEALPLFEVLVARQPEVPEHWTNLGNALCELGREAEALPPLQQAFQRGDRGSALFYALARAELANGRPLPALTCIERALALEALDPEFLLFRARVLFAMDETDQAAATLAALRSPALPFDLRVEAAEIQLNLANYADAQRAFEALLGEDPGHPGALIGLSTCHERHNRLDEADAVRARVDAARAGAAPAVASALAQLDARLAARRGRPEAARALFEAVLADPPRDPALRTNLRFELGKACAEMRDHAAAFSAFSQGHAERLAHVNAAHPNLMREDGLLAALDRPVPPFQTGVREGADDGHRDPLFVVGFPRSGTTLLEQLLDAHPGLASFDEQPFLQRLVTRMNALPGGYPGALVDLPAERRRDFRARYFADVQRQRPDLGGRRPVDKNPLYLVRLPLVAALFPDARAVLALRHPCDVVVSCWMQNFRAPAFAVTFETLKTTARMYDRVFRTYFDFRDAIGVPTHVLRYEDLVADVAAEGRRLFGFLGLDWRDELLGFTERAKSRGVISTPSYTQVVQPVNRRAVGRWQAWRPWFDAETLDLLAPWAERFGYSLD
ncbi:tetratricopeptide repeat-containing sulfotransferase family protein [Silanimonas algicola]